MNSFFRSFDGLESERSFFNELIDPGPAPVDQKDIDYILSTWSGSLVDAQEAPAPSFLNSPSANTDVHVDHTFTPFNTAFEEALAVAVGCENPPQLPLESAPTIEKDSSSVLKGRSIETDQNSKIGKKRAALSPLRELELSQASAGLIKRRCYAIDPNSDSTSHAEDLPEYAAEAGSTSDDRVLPHDLSVGPLEPQNDWEDLFRASPAPALPAEFLDLENSFAETNLTTAVSEGLGQHSNHFDRNGAKASCCGQSFKTRSQYSLHRRDQARIYPRQSVCQLTCQGCKMRLSGWLTASRHFDTVHCIGPMVATCRLCGNVPFSSKRAYSTHYREVHSTSTTFKDTNAQSPGKTAKEGEKSSRSHLRAEIYCPKCPELANCPFMTMTSLNRHNKLKHTPNAPTYHCDSAGCRYHTKNKNNLKTHMVRHIEKQGKTVGDGDHSEHPRELSQAVGICKPH